MKQTTWALIVGIFLVSMAGFSPAAVARYNAATSAIDVNVHYKREVPPLEAAAATKSDAKSNKSVQPKHAVSSQENNNGANPDKYHRTVSTGLSF